MAGPRPLRSHTRFSVSLDGRYATSFALDGNAPARLERWSLMGPFNRRRLGPNGDVPLDAQAVCVRRGSILLNRPAPGRNEISLVRASSAGLDGLTERPIGTIASAGLRLIPGPDPAIPAVAISTDGTGVRLWTVTTKALRPVLTLPGKVLHTFWLGNGRLGILRASPNGTQETVVADLHTGRWHPLPGLPEGGRVLTASPRSGRLLLSVPAPGRRAFAFSTIKEPGDLTVPGKLNALRGAVVSAAMSPWGARTVFHVAHGARSHLVVSDAAGELDTLPLREGAIHGPLTWSALGIGFPFSTPTVPTHLATVARNTTTWRTTLTGPDTAGGHDARLIELPGATGPVECVVYGTEPPAEAQQTVLALHDGPAGAWRLGFDPLFQQMAEAGLTVVAVNPAGSTGYGRRPASVLRGAWGGPDLADLLQVAEHLAAA
ncbi:prolyl oligopeptidase family serine peptidase, partial [Actinocorallia lasiicapitis]